MLECGGGDFDEVNLDLMNCGCVWGGGERASGKERVFFEMHGVRRPSAQAAAAVATTTTTKACPHNCVHKER